MDILELCRRTAERGGSDARLNGSTFYAVNRNFVKFVQFRDYNRTLEINRAPNHKG